MFVIALKFAGSRERAGEFMEAHKDWIKKGFDEGVFLMVGNLQPSLGGALLAHGASREEVEKRVAEDPFVAEKIVTADILEITPGRTDERLAFLAD